MNMKTLLSQSLTDDDIYNFFGNKVRIIKYSTLKEVKDVGQILNPTGFCIILFELHDHNNGHWTLLQKCKVRGREFLLFFDSYGYEPENELNYVRNAKLLEETDQDRGLLLSLLYNQPLPVHYNNFRLQKIKTNINTCGKYCCVKALYPNLDENQFEKILRSTDFTPDELICLLYEDFSHRKNKN